MLRVALTIASALLTFAVAFPATCFAQHMNSSVAPCHNVTNLADEANCFYQASQAADKKLNQTYTEIRAALKNRGGNEDLQKNEDLQNLVSTQRSWVQFRDASCKAERALYEGGTEAPRAYNSCIEELTRQRTADLKTMYGWVVVKFGSENSERR